MRRFILSTDVAVMSYRPGRIKQLFPVALPIRVPTTASARMNAFLQLKVAITELVREEINKHVEDDA